MENLHHNISTINNYILIYIYIMLLNIHYHYLNVYLTATYTYTLRLALQRIGNEKLHYNNVLSDHSSSDFRHLAGSTGEGLDRLVMQSDLRDIFHGVTVASFDPVTVGPVSVSKPGQTEPGVVVSFHVQVIFLVIKFLYYN